MSEATRLLNQMQAGDLQAADKMLQLVYEELRQIAAHLMQNERPDHTLQATILVHDAWMRLAGSEEKQRQYAWAGKQHFFCVAAKVMRQSLIDHARKRNRLRRGAGQTPINLDDVDLAATVDDDTLLGMDEALVKLAVHDEVKAELVELRFFLGMSIPEAAETMGFSEATAKRHWTLARAWLYDELKQSVNNRVT